MSHSRYLAGSIALVAAALAAVPVSAFFHQWDFAEIYSNANGTVQFIEMQTTAPNERFSDGAQIRSTATGNIYNFSGELPGSTTNMRFVIATSGFGSLAGGVAPDFADNPPLPANFFNPNGDTLRFCQGTCTGGNIFDTRTFTSIPTDGVFSRIFPSNTDAANSPRNFAGNTGSVNRGDYNRDGFVDAADYIHWRKTFTASATPAGNGADGDTDGAIDDGDYTLWTNRFGNSTLGAGSGNGGFAIAPEPSTLGMAFVAWATLTLRRRRS